MLNGRLELGSNVVAQFESISGYDPANLPLRFTRKIVSRARAMWLGYWSTSASDNYAAPPASASSIGWLEESGTLIVTALPGMSPGTTYDFTLVVV